MSKQAGNKKEGPATIALPGDFLASPEEFLPGQNAYEQGDSVRASLSGRVEKDLSKMAEVRSILCNCLLLVVDGQQVLTMTRMMDGDAYAITSTDPTLVRLGLDYWESPRCCVM